MKVITKVLVGFLVVILLTSVLAGCKKPSDGDNTSTASKTQTTGKTTVSGSKTTSTSASASARPSGTTSSTGGTQTTPGDEDETGDNDEDVDVPGEDAPGDKDIDLGGMTILLGFHRAVRYPDPNSSDQSIRFFWEQLKIAEEKYNCKFEFTGAQYTNNAPYSADILQNAIAGTETRDLIFTIPGWIMPNLVESGLFLAMEDYLEQDTDVWNDIVTSNTMWKGKHYAITMGNLVKPNRSMFYNTHLLYAAGYPDIWEYVEAGTWDWDRFLDIAINTTLDLDGDGTIDQWGVAADQRIMADNFIHANGGSYLRLEDGQFKFNMDSPNSVMALQFLSDLYNVYKVSAYYDSQYLNVVRQGRGVMCFQNAGQFNAVFPDPAVAAIMGCAPIPKGPLMDTHISGIDIGTSEMYAFPSTMKSPKDVIPVIADVFHGLYNANKEAGLMRITAERWFAANPDNIERVMKVNDRYEAITWPEVAAFPDLQTLVRDEIYNKVVRQETTPANALSANTPRAQEIIDSVMGLR